MNEILKKSTLHPLFKPTLASGISGITSGAQLLISLGIDISDETIIVLKKIENILRDATYNSLDLDVLLKEARAIGDSIDQKAREKNSKTLGEKEDTDSS